MARKKAKDILPSYDETRLRSLKNEISEASAKLEEVVEELVKRNSSDLDDFIEWAKERIESRDELTDADLEKMAIRVPVYMYFAAGGVEKLGIEYDSAKFSRLEAFNRMYEGAEGTIQDKKTSAELETLTEQFLEIAFQRAYKELKAKLDICEHICLSVRKIIGKRTQEFTIHKFDKDVERND